MREKMTIFQDSDGNIITEATETIIIKFHDRYVINNYPFSCTEGDKVFVFDQENLDKIWKYYDNQIIQIREEMINLTEQAIELAGEFKQENDNLRKLNKELSETIIELKEK